MTRGRKICKTLKEIRQQIADKNDIEYITSECHFQGECQGTCPKCEAELKYLENELNKRTQLGKIATIAGISLSIASTFSACNAPQEQLQSQQNNISTRYDVEDEVNVVVGMINTADTIKIDYDDTYIFDFVEIMPSFPGGDKELMKFLSDNIIYPKSAREIGIEGMVIVKFVVTKDGRISDVNVQKSPHKLLSDEAVRVIKLMPKWIQGKQNGEAVNVYFIQPISFQLN
jgi:TonB family protein